MWKAVAMARFEIIYHHLAGRTVERRDISARIARGAVHSTVTFGSVHRAGALNQAPLPPFRYVNHDGISFECFDYSLTVQFTAFYQLLRLYSLE
jgi:hypothetical protein